MTDIPTSPRSHWQNGAIIQTLYNLGSTFAALVVGYANRRLYRALTALGTVSLDLSIGMLIGFLLGIGTTTGRTLDLKRLGILDASSFCLTYREQG